jgi:hypothetical protein
MHPTVSVPRCGGGHAMSIAPSSESIPNDPYRILHNFSGGLVVGTEPFVNIILRALLARYVVSGHNVAVF